MSKNQKNLSIDEIFYAMPKLRNYFRDREWKIRKYEKAEKVEKSVENWREEKELLLQVAHKMDIDDLRAVYCLQTLEKLTKGQIVKKLQKLVREMQDFLQMS